MTSTDNKTKASRCISNVPNVESKRKNAILEEFLEVMQPKARKMAAPHSFSPEKDKAPSVRRDSQNPPEEVQQNLTDMEWMQQRMRGGLGDPNSPEKVFEQSDNDENDQEVSNEKDSTEKTILLTARLFVRNLTFTCTAEELRPLFEQFGPITQVSRIYL
jgi:multiple RNA-binding domain-containing protein 1